ncbi:MAG: hypothetical protein K6T29_10350 [Peptococcaceae bacterium]|nr:hypothetical protein [Peptococcaceae bacterium]
MAKRTTISEDGFKRPGLPGDSHRPAGVPRPREIKSQKAQLASAHRHGTEKGLKIGMTDKLGPAGGDGR